MQPMSTFDPDRSAKVHDSLNDKTFDWRTGWAADYRRNAMVNMVDGTVSFDGLILDSWKALPAN
jgi:hypothetical protein